MIRPTLLIGLKLLREFFGRHVHRVERLRGQIRCNGRIRHGFLQFGIELVHDRLGVPAGANVPIQDVSS